MKVIFLIITSLLLSSVIYGQPDGVTILKNVEERFKEIRDYTAEAKVSVEMERLRIPRREIKIFFKQPEKFHIESEGFAMMPRAGLAFIPSHLHYEKYEVKILTNDTINTHPSYKLQLSLKDTQRSTLVPGQSFYLWVDKIDYVIRKIETATPQGRTIHAEFDYGIIDKKHLMPSSIVVTLENLSDGDDDTPDMPDREKRRRRLPRSGTITITFTKYLVNQNLPDKLFEKSEKK